MHNFAGFLDRGSSRTPPGPEGGVWTLVGGAPGRAMAGLPGGRVSSPSLEAVSWRPIFEGLWADAIAAGEEDSD